MITTFLFDYDTNQLSEIPNDLFLGTLNHCLSNNLECEVGDISSKISYYGLPQNFNKQFFEMIVAHGTNCTVYRCDNYDMYAYVKNE